MKISEAKEIISYISQWQFVLMGIKERHEVSLNKEFNKYSLSDLMKANRMVVANNSRVRKLAEYNRNLGRNVKSYSQQVTCADRLIAAVYTALHFPANGEMVVLINDIAVGCVKPNYND